MTSLEARYYEHEAFWCPSIDVLGEAHRARARQVLDLVPADVRSLLDLGCGNGIFCDLAAERLAGPVVGLDRSRAALRHVRGRKVVGLVDAVPLAPGRFDCATLLEVIEHLPVPAHEAALREVGRLAPRYVVVSVPNEEVLEEGLTRCPACRTRFHRDLHLRTFSEAGLRCLLDRHGYRCREVHRLGEQREAWLVARLRAARRRAAESAMQSPLCPVCGHENPAFLHDAPAPTRSPAPPSVARRIARALVPHTSRWLWLAALYERHA